jgi:hypothetical protein
MNSLLQKYKSSNLLIIEDKNIYIFPWSFGEYDRLPLFLKEVIETEIENFDIYILAAEEYEIGSNFERQINYSFTEKLLKQSIRLHFIFGSSNLNFYKNKNFLYYCPERNSNVYLWPTYWFYQTLQSVDYFFIQKYKNLEKELIKYSFCSLNNVGKYHRCLLIDLLAKNKILDQGAVSWQDFCVDTDYHWSWTTSEEAKRGLSDNEKYIDEKYKIQFTPPDEFFQSFMSIVSETTDKTIFITEKTALCLLLGQPFLVQGAVGFHNYLKILGFKLYDEIFDYSFDFEENIHSRTQGIIDNIKSLDVSNLISLYKKIKSKIHYNQTRFLEIVKNKEQMPDIVKIDATIHDHYFLHNISFLDENL